MPLRRLKSAPFAALALALSALLTACGGGSPGGSTTTVPPAATYTAASGVAQKGPMTAGSTVTARELGLNLSATGNQYTYATTSMGAFTPSDKYASALLAVTATGTYADEVTGAASDGPVTLKSYANLGTETVLNVNVLTTLAFTRINTLLNTNGMSFADARAQAEREVLATFGVVLGASPGAFGSLDASADTDGGHLLAALSSVVVQGRTSAQVNALLATLQADIASNGANVASADRQPLVLSAQALDLAKVAANLSAIYGKPVDANALAQWLDQDGDGVIAHDEFRVDDATPASSFALPADFVAARAGMAVTTTAGQLVVNGTAVTGAATWKAGDTVALAAPATLPDGVLKAYLQAGGTRVARVTFVKGLTAIAIAPTSGALPLGISQRFTATGTYADGHTADVSDSVTWTSSAPAVADIGAASGLADALTLGATTITASSGTASGTLSLHTVAATIQSMVVAPATLQTGVGITRRFTATGTFSDGSVADVTSSATWATQTAGVASVSNGAASGLAIGTTSVTATLGTVAASASVAVTTNTWTAAPPMPTERVAGHTATLLTGGKLLVAGGVKSAGAGTAAADVFDPVALTWTSVAPMNVMRSSHAATLLADGRVLVTGGSTVSSTAAKGYVNNASAEIYDPVTNTWTATPPMGAARSHHTATLLPDGKVLVVGGENAQYLVEPTAEIYDPVANTWSAPRSQPIARRSQHTATPLPSGLVLIAGGFDIVNGLLTPLTSAELYDPVLHTTTSTDSHGVTTALVTGGQDFTATTPMAFTHYGHSATRLADGRVVVVGGNTTQTEIYDPVAGGWTTQGATAATHTSHGAVLLADGRILVAGGTQFAQPAAELFDPASGVWTAAATMLVTRSNPTATLMPDGSVMVCGGALDSAGVDCETWW
ncbi:kelch repeat-containing protein [Scleromatobacter humisilvae]|uniref:Ig-like domain-containing protein n=1 Tax=Scleromatobacter humisilvae TaxID=2897159 RepID=A0A9X2C232_9BURK|nr:kelch repeat-containing protein [Scleromatobacter humisilvae]MCK9689493.1 Ig-like domain-containing protein [Scleromatobacter humisilvae]